MSQATLREIIEQERAASRPDTDTLVLLRRSKLKAPEGFYCWSLVAIRTVMAEDPSGYLPDGSHQGAVR